MIEALLARIVDITDLKLMLNLGYLMYGRLIEQRTSRHGCPRLGTASSIHDDVHLGQDPDFGSRAPHVTTQP